MSLLIYGGNYLEECLSPSHNELAGSGLRAARVLQVIAPGNSFQFLTTLYPSTKMEVEGALRRCGNIVLHPQCAASDAVSAPYFKYINSLAPPRWSFAASDAGFHDGEIKVDSALVFGSLEDSPKITADTVVFDPQCPIRPDHFHANGSRSKRCALVLNQFEATRLAGNANLFEAVDFLRRYCIQGKHPIYEVIVVKMGHAGCWICTTSGIESVPAFSTANVFSIGSGDIFSGTFFAKWALDGMEAGRAAEAASMVTARYCLDGVISSRLANDLSGDKSLHRLPNVSPKAPLREKQIYLAGPFFSQGEIALIELLREVLQTPWTKVFSPMHEVGFGGPSEVYAPDIKGLEESDVVFAVLSGKDAGTIFEVGFAAKTGKPICCLAESVHEKDLTMIRGCGASISTDITSAVYKALWATLD